MMRETDMRKLTILVLVATLAACGSDRSADEQPTVGKEIADDYNRQLDEARAVEEQVMEQKRQIDEALKAAEDN